MIHGITLKNGANVLCADLKTERDGVEGHVLASFHGELVTWHVWQETDGEFWSEAGEYHDADDMDGALASYNQRRTPPEPTLPASLSLAEGPWAERLVREARAVHR